MKVKEKLTPGWDIYHRIVWDSRLNAAAFAIGYSDRMAEGGMKEKPLLEWDAQGDIPWHRVRYFRCGDVIVWDREARIDLLETDELPDIAWAERNSPQAQQTDRFAARPVYTFGASDWQPCQTKPQSGSKPAKLRLLTWNILCDLFEKERICSDQRLPVIFQYLQEAQADVIALQEVSGEVCAWLQAQPWIQENYYSSDVHTATALAPHGVLILSKHPFSLVEHRFSSQKRFLLASFSFHSTPLHLGVVHLTSNRSSDAAEKRKAQLQIIADYCQNLTGEVFLLGDFNDRSGESADFLAQYQWSDYWKKLRPDDAGYTFDVQRNDFARLFSLSGEPGRLDYIFGRSQHWQGEAIQILATEAFEGREGQRLFASDHFALCLDLSYNAVQMGLSPELLARLQQSQPTYETALVLIPPQEVWPPIQALRQQFDAKVGRWMPHITLVYGFVPREWLAAAAQAIVPILSAFQPQEIQLSGYRYFTHRNNITAWLAPETEPADWLQRLQAALQAIFPNCPEQSNRAAGFQPHLSIGQFADQPTAERLLLPWKPISFTAARLAIIARKGNQPFQEIYTLSLGDGQVTAHLPWQAALDRWMPLPDSQQQAQRQWLLSLVEEACTQVLGASVSLLLIGSSRLGTVAADSDLDCLCLLPPAMSPLVFFRAVEQVLLPIATTSRLVADAQVPILKLEIEGLALDLLAAEYQRFGQATRQYASTDFNPAGWQAMGGVLEAQYIESQVPAHTPMDDFRTFVRVVKAWAKARKLTGNGWGLLGSFSWTVLAAYSWREYHQNQRASNIEACLAHFFRMLADWDGRQPIALSSEGLAYQPHPLRDRLPIVTSVSPCFNSARNITASTAQLLQSEAQRAAACFSATDTHWTRLFEAANFDYPFYYQLTIYSENAEQRAEAWGWIEGNFVGLLIQLEQETGQRFRPVYEAAQGLRLYYQYAIENLPQSVRSFQLMFKWAVRGAELRIVL